IAADAARIQHYRAVERIGHAVAISDVGGVQEKETCCVRRTAAAANDRSVERRARSTCQTCRAHGQHDRSYAADIPQADQTHVDLRRYLRSGGCRLFALRS